MDGTGFGGRVGRGWEADQLCSGGIRVAHSWGIFGPGRICQRIAPIVQERAGMSSLARGLWLLVLCLLICLPRPTANPNSYGKLTSRRGRWSARIRAQPASHSANMITKETCMGTTAVSDTATRYWEGALGAAWPAAPRAVEPNRWDWGFARRQNSTEVNSALSIQSSSPRFCTKTSGGLGLGLGPRLGGRGQGAYGRAAGTGVHLRHAASLSGFANVGEPLLLLVAWPRVPGPRRAVQSFAFPQPGLLHS